MTTFVGIDPGKTGGITSLRGDGKLVWSKFTTWQEMKSFIDSEVRMSDSVFVALEDVHGFPGMHVKAVTTFMKNAGGWEALLEVMGVSHSLIPPTRWQKNVLGVFPKGESKPRALAFAQKYWPAQQFRKAHSGPIDAALLALYLQRLSLGQVHQTDSPPKPKKKRVNSNIEVPGPSDSHIQDLLSEEREKQFR